MGRHALLVATGEYDDLGLASMRSPAADAAALKSVLEDENVGAYDVTVLSDAPYHLIGEAIGRFLRERTGDDTALIYISCHGLRNDDGELWFAGTNTVVRQLEDTALSAGRVARQMDRSLCRRIVLILDCCFSGAFTGALTGIKGSSDISGVISHSLGGQGRIIITATTATEYAFHGDNPEDLDSRPSVFTEVLVEGLASGEADLDGDGEITASELFRYVDGRVRPHQTPTLTALNLQGEVIIARGRKGPEAAPGVSSAKQRIVHLDDVLSAYMDDLDFRASGRFDPPAERFPWGFAQMDRLTQGIWPGELTVVIGSFDMAAAALVHNVALHAGLELAKRVLLASPDLTPTELLHRLIAPTMRVPLSRLRDGYLSDDEWSRIARTIGRLVLEASFKLVEDPRGLTMEGFKALALKEPDCDLIGLTGAETLAHSPQSQPWSLLSAAQGLRELAENSAKPVIAAFAFSGPEMQRSAALLDQHADTILNVRRLVGPDPGSPGQVHFDVEVLKNPHGPLAYTPVVFESDFGKLTERDH